MRIVKSIRYLIAFPTHFHESWGKLYEWTVRQDFEPKSPCRDNYLNDPHEVPEEELFTELLIPVS